MTKHAEILSPSPWFWNMTNSPAWRKRFVYELMHEDNRNPQTGEFTGSVVDEARRARDYQAAAAELAEALEAVIKEFDDPARNYISEHGHFIQLSPPTRAKARAAVERLRKVR